MVFRCFSVCVILWLPTAST